MSLPKNEKTFQLSVVGETSGERWEGTFSCICVPPIGLKNKIDRDELRETGDLANISTELFLRSRWLVNVQNRLFSWPDWWEGCRRGANLLDVNVIKALYDELVLAESEWRLSVKKKAATTPTPESSSSETPTA